MTTAVSPVVVAGPVSHEFTVTGAQPVVHPYSAGFLLTPYQVVVVLDRVGGDRVSVWSRCSPAVTPDRPTGPPHEQPYGDITLAPRWVQDLHGRVKAGASW